ncbi:MAG: hypothetical protein CL534_00990 [Ahrensia sp.]|nr:hypothetical protein [Ahrensia sp.]
MKMDELKQRLEDERCGLFILAGYDEPETSGGVLTIHAFRDALSQQNRAHIESSVTELDPGIAVRFRAHSSGDLHAPGSLEAFAELFEHEHIVSDPTGAFGRVTELLRLARQIRSDRAPVRSILWQPHASALVVVAQGAGPHESEALETAIGSLIDTAACDDLRKTIRSVSVGATMPAGRYTPVDALSRPAPKTRSRLAGLLARASGIAALIGLGTMTAAHAATPPADLEDDALMPGLIALVDLTTLGENAYGGRNQFRAVGGLRLYFGASGLLKASAFRPGGEIDMIFTVPEGTSEDVAPETVPMPVRVAYGC